MISPFLEVLLCAGYLGIWEKPWGMPVFRSVEDKGDELAKDQE